MGRMKICKILPQQLASHTKKEDVTHETKQNEKIIVALRHGREALKPQYVLDYKAA